LNAKSCVSQPSDLYSVQFHDLRAFACDWNILVAEGIGFNAPA
jgi:hypothetical protein